jgi:hypothetical protein
VESKADNEARKNCKGGAIVITEYQGVKLELLPNGVCECKGAKCISMIEERVARAKL